MYSRNPCVSPVAIICVFEIDKTAPGRSGHPQTGPCDALGGTWAGISRIRYDEVELLAPSISVTRLSGGFMHMMNAKDFRYLYDGASSTLGPVEELV